MHSTAAAMLKPNVWPLLVVKRLLTVVCLLQGFPGGHGECGGTFTSREGTFQSPGFPNNYTNNARCYYRISQPEGYRITLTFHHFDFIYTGDSGEGVCEDYVMVHDGNSATSPRIYSDTGNICGLVKTPIVRRSTENQMLVRFTSDHIFTATGFNATYTSAIFEEDFMLAGNVGTNEIIRLDMETLSYIKIPVADVTSPKDIVYDPVDDRIYWTANKTIETAVLHGAYKSVLPNLDNEDAEYDGIALDILARRIFYTDAGNNVIGDIRIPDYEYRTFITSGLDQPRDIVLHTGIRVMFWTDVGKEPKIERANYDGTGRVVIIQNLKQPNALSIDLKNERLYWTDAETDLVTSSDLDGGDQRQIYKFGAKVHVFGMALHGNQIYFTDWSGNKSDSSLSYLRRMNFDGTDETELMDFEGHLYDIHIYTRTNLPEPETSTTPTEVTTTSDTDSTPTEVTTTSDTANTDGTNEMPTNTADKDGNTAVIYAVIGAACVIGLVIIVVVIIVIFRIVATRSRPKSSPALHVVQAASRNEGDGCFQVQNVAFQQDDSSPYDVLSESVRAPFHPRNAHPALTPSSKQSALGEPEDDYLEPSAGLYTKPGAHDNATGKAGSTQLLTERNTSNDYMQLTGDKCGPTSGYENC